MAEDAKVAVRNERREANRHIDLLANDKSAHLSEDAAKDAKETIDELTKKHVERIDEIATKKVQEIETV
jgi:ribosome recycling factor